MCNVLFSFFVLFLMKEWDTSAVWVLFNLFPRVYLSYEFVLLHRAIQQ